MTRLSIHIARPVILWALHFAAVYALISAGCAARDLMDPAVLRATVAIVTLGVALVLLVWLIMAGRVRRSCDPARPEFTLAQTAWWVALISLLAVLANLWPVALMTTCSG